MGYQFPYWDWERGRCAIDCGIIVIPKTITKSRIAENFNVFDFKLTSEDLEQIGSLDCNSRLIPQAEGREHKDHPFAHGDE